MELSLRSNLSQDFFPESIVSGSKEQVKEKIRKLLELL
jgi:hypothetical protein